MFNVPNNRRIGEAIPSIAFNRLSSSRDYGNNGAFYLPRQSSGKGNYFLCIASDGMGWEHVSVSIPSENRCPTWEEMCYIKSQFWEDADAVMQLHPPRKDWINNHPYCLHLWRPVNQDIPLPASIMVGKPILNTSKNQTR